MIPRLDSSVTVTVAEPSQVGEARRRAVALAESLGFGPTQAGNVAVVVTEAATNLVKHTTGGLLALRAVEGPTPTVEVLALDRGPGMADVQRCLEDGYSTAGSPGNGLGAIRRLAALFDVHSRPGVGSAVLAQLSAGPPGGAEQVEIGAVCLPFPGEEQCGDAWAISHEPDRCLLLVVDGLGHGPLATTAAREAVRIFEANIDRRPAEILQLAHPALRPTRGAAVAVAEIALDSRQVRFAGVGNIAGRIIQPNGTSRGLVSHNGTLGHQLHSVGEFTYPWPEGAVLVLHSDGLQTQWGLDRYPGLLGQHPGLIAGVLYRDFGRKNDDATVVVARDVPR
jgi:anti-sigma regulatory factor (Ser/Thr protein kinase)